MTFRQVKLNCQYALGAFFALPIVPVLYFQGKQVRKRVPNLPEASGMEGVSAEGTNGTFKVLLIGESTMAGVGVATNEEGFAGSLASALHLKLDKTVHWKVYAKSGYAAQRILEEVLPTITTKEADLIVLGMGANDTLEINTPYTWGKYVKEILSALQKQFPTTPIAFANMPPVNDFEALTPLLQVTLGNLSFLLKEELEVIVSEYPSVYFDNRLLAIESWIKGKDTSKPLPKLFSDGVHPSKYSYQIWASHFADFLLQEVLRGIGKK